MAAPDYDVIKEIPGYKVILKAVLKSQIQQLVEQLATSTDEESVILTASVADGTLSHLGSDSGKGFLEDHEDIKSQFLGFCLKKHHRKKQEEKERLEAEALQQSLQASPVRFGGPRGPYGPRSPRFASPRGQGPIHPVALTRASPGQLRHQPYPMTRPPKLKRPPLNFDPGRSPVGMPSHSPMRSPTANKLDGQIIKIEPDDSNEASNQSENETGNQDNSDNASQSPSHAANAPSSVKSESGEKDDDARSESSNSTIPNEPPAEGLSLDSDLSNLISGNNQEQSSETTSEMDPNVSVKLEALTENEMDLEITGVEPGRPMVPQDNWDPNVSMGMNYDPTGATGNQGDMSAQGYNLSGTYGLLEPGAGDYTEMVDPYVAGTSESTEQYRAILPGVHTSKIGKLPLTGLHALSAHGLEGSMSNTECSDRVASSFDGNIDKFAIVKNIGPSDVAHCFEVIIRNGEKMYKCGYKDCGKVFTRKFCLDRHFQTHKREKLFICTFCGLKYSRKDNLRVHLLRKH
ncbi:B-cell CLL/lymphoma 6 member B protein-like isoform X3 [Ruditapes philippinarum]|uniref:B-cell CLL/lymphoma 6 member B protein-like isoform X3 n=1 Tax=Ruditapes philippinarum TaxID=129788 RepID=UPI00295B54C2|nr:B-cell CLL/lymphoma 6 member B protein-like isoform X3 [Ruditapes philippinarum]